MAHLIAASESIESLSRATTTPASGSRLSPQVTPTDWYVTSRPPYSVLPPEVVRHPLLEEANWVALRDSGREPLDASPMVTTYQSRAEFLVGAWLVDKVVPMRAGGSLLASLHKAPQMLRENDVLATERRRNAILMPRRSSKTTTLWCILLGRCYMRPLHLAAYTMLTLAKKSEERFDLDVRNPIREQWKDPKLRPVKLLDGKGGKGVEFSNGSKLSIVAPKGDDIRSGAYDTVVMDEGGEPEPEDWDDIVGAVIPSFDTRIGAQIIYAGTGGKYREGSHFWATLHNEKAGRIRYGVPDDINPKLLDSWEAGAGKLIEQLHPGLDGLTTLEVIRDNFPDLGPARFGLEYLGHFGTESGNKTLMSANDWADTRAPGAVPTGIEPLVLSFAVHFGGAWASVAVGWTEEVQAQHDLVEAALLDAGELDAPPPIAAFKLIHHQDGTGNLARTLFTFARDLGLPIVHDDAPQEKAVMGEVQRLAKITGSRIDGDVVRYAEKAVATTKLLNGIKHKRVRHWAQEPLDAAAKIAVPRASGKAVLIGGTEAMDDVTPLDAGALVLLRMPDEPLAEAFDPIVL